MKGSLKIMKILSVSSLAVVLLVGISSETLGEEKFFTNSIGMKFVYIPPGTFMMGSAISASDAAKRYGGVEVWYKNEYPQHKVAISKPFYMQATEVTQAQWREIMGNSPSTDKGDDSPVEEVSWNDVKDFIRRLNQKEGTNKYHLPTEAQWEYGCRAGSTTRVFFGNSATSLGQYAWYSENSRSRIHPVGGKKPNPWGLYDMYGNVWEWCQDWYGDYPPGHVTDPKGAFSGKYRVLRGGSWLNLASNCRSANRNMNTPYNHNHNVGFRLVRSF